MHEEGAVGEARRDAEVLRHAADQEPRCRAPRARGSTRASTWSSSCRASRRPRAPTCRRARSRRATAAPTCTAGRASRIASISGLPRVTTLPTTNTSAPFATRVELRGVVPLGQRDAERLELVAHRRVDVGVAAGHPVPGGLRDRRDAAHERAADAEDVQMHGVSPAAGAPPRARRPASRPPAPANHASVSDVAREHDREREPEAARSVEAERRARRVDDEARFPTASQSCRRT